MNEFKKINNKYNDDTYPMYPYIHPNRVTPLRKGLYRKYGANYRGVTAVYDEETKEFTFPLYGMYYVPDDIVIVPDNINLNESKSVFLDAVIKSGFKRVPKAPKFQPTFFPADSPEAKLALANKAHYYRSKRNSITI